MTSNRSGPPRVIITGGLGVLGRSVAAVLKARGMNVALLDRAQPGEELEGLQVHGGVDLADVQSTKDAFAAVAEKFGGIDAVVNIAGGFQWELLESGALETWDKMYSMNVRTAVVSCREAIPHLTLQGGGRIVNVGALAALKAGAGMGAYAASKSGVARLTEALAEELKDRHITVNAVLPSILDTPANRADMPTADPSRWVSPVSLGAVIAFLLSDDARDISGASLPVAGKV